MDMGTVQKGIGPFKHPADKDFIFPEYMTADRTKPVPFSAKAVNTAFYMHQAVFTAVQGRKSKGFYQESVFQFGTAHRTGPWFTGNAVFWRFFAPEPPSIPPFSPVLRKKPGISRYLYTCTEKKGITKP